MLNITILGYPGSGKSLHAGKLATVLEVVHIEMGKVLRELARAGHKAGNEIGQYLREGRLIPDDLAMKIILEVVQEHLETGGFIFDGFPRTVKQAFLLDEDFDQRAIPLPVAFYLLTDKQTALHRILDKRAPGSDREDDQDRTLVERRIEQESARLEDVVEYYGQRNRLYICNAEQPPEIVQRDILNILARKTGGKPKTTI